MRGLERPTFSSSLSGVVKGISTVLFLTLFLSSNGMLETISS